MQKSNNIQIDYHSVGEQPKNIGGEDAKVADYIPLKPVAKGIWKSVSHYSKTISVCQFEESMESADIENLIELPHMLENEANKDGELVDNGKFKRDYLISDRVEIHTDIEELRGLTFNLG